MVGEAGTAEEALDAHPAARPTSPCSTCACPTATARGLPRDPLAHPDMRCLMLTSFSDDEALFDAIMAGAAGYVLKQIRGTDLVDAVRRSAAGESLLDPRRHGPGARPAAATQARGRARSAALTDQERRILELIAEGLTNRQIGERDVPRREDRQELRVEPARQAGHERRTEAAVYAARLAERHRDTP